MEDLFIPFMRNPALIFFLLSLLLILFPFFTFMCLWSLIAIKWFFSPFFSLMYWQQVYDKDTFSTDDRMGEAEIDIQPLVSAAKAFETSTIGEYMQLGKWLASEDNTLVKDSTISIVDGKVKQDITLKLKNVDKGELEVELECLPLSQWCTKFKIIQKFTQSEEIDECYMIQLWPCDDGILVGCGRMRLYLSC